MKFILNLITILIILFQTGNVFSDDIIFNVNNIELNKEFSKNKEKLANEAFKKGFEKLTNRLLLEKDYKKITNTSLDEIKNLISYYQIGKNIKKDENKIIVNISFDKNSIHNFFYKKNILYSDILNTEVIFFPLLVENKQQFIYSKNYFLDNWKSNNSEELIQYSLPLESIENIEIIKRYKNDIFKLSTSEFFKEYDMENKVFVIIEKDNDKAKIFLNTEISKNKLKKNIILNNTFTNSIDFNNKIILEVKKTVKELIKSQNLIDVRTPSFLNVKIKLKNENNLVILSNRLKKINLISNYKVQQLSKDYALVKIRYYGQISKIIKKIKDQKMDLKKNGSEWLLNII